MTRKLPKILFTLLLTAVVAVSAWADRPWLKWSPDDGVSIRQGYHTEWYRGGEGRYNGNNLIGEVGIIWSDCRNGDRGSYLQVIGVNGALKFQINGAQVTDAPNRQEDPAVWPSRDGGWYCGWEDFDADSAGDIYATKVDANGRRIWGETERGIAVCQISGIQSDLRIVDDGEGGCIMAWHDERGGDPGDLYAQHILSDGRVDPDWPANGMPIVRAVGAQVSHTADEDGLGGMIIGWKDNRNIGNSDIWAQRITPRGELLWGNGEGIAVCANGANQEAPKLCPDGANGAFFTWVDDRNSQTSDRDLYCQRVSADGQLMWPADGEILCNEREEQTDARIVDSESGNAIVTWEDKRADGLTFDIYSMRISGVNRMRKEWDSPQGVEIAVVQRNQQQVRLFPDGQGGAYYCWEDERDGGFPEIDIWAQRINRSGQILWQRNGVPVCRVPGNQNSPLIRRTADGGCFLAWGDSRTGSQEIWGQRLNGNGEPQWTVDGIPIVAGFSGNALGPEAIPRGDGWVTFLWLDSRAGGFGSVPYIQNIRDGREAVDTAFVHNGVPALTGTIGGTNNPDGCFDGAHGTIIVWEDHRVGDIYSIYAQKVSDDGQRMWGESGLKVADYDYEQAYPRVCTDGAGGAIIAWRATSEVGDNNIFAQRLDQNGDRMWGDRGIVIAGTEFEESIEKLISDGENGAIITWQLTRYNDDNNLDDDLYITRLNHDGEAIWGGADGRLPICNVDGKQRTSEIVRHQSGFVVVWVDGRSDYGDGMPGLDIWGQMFRLDGGTYWTENGTPLTQGDYNQDNPVVAVDNRGFVWVAWEDQRNGSVVRGADIYGMKFNWHTANGNPQRLFTGDDEGDGRVICGYNYNQTRPIILHDGQNGLWVVWEDARGLAHSDIYGTHLDRYGHAYMDWNADGNAICTAFHRQIFPSLALLTPGGVGGCAIFWEDKRATGKEELSNLFAQLMDATPLEVEEVAQPLPTGFAIESVYPNPFNSRTFITFTLPQAGLVRAVVYDISGRTALELGSKQMHAGTYRFAIDGEGLASGQYLVRIEASGTSVQRAIQLVK